MVKNKIQRALRGDFDLQNCIIFQDSVEKKKCFLLMFSEAFELKRLWTHCEHDVNASLKKKNELLIWNEAKWIVVRSFFFFSQCCISFNHRQFYNYALPRCTTQCCSTLKLGENWHDLLLSLRNYMDGGKIFCIFTRPSIHNALGKGIIIRA